jgi:hypothetical protein
MERFMDVKTVRTVVFPAIVLALALALAACGGSSGGSGDTSSAPPSPQATGAALAAGDSVAAVWTDGNYYLATVTEVGAGQVTVQYVDDGSTGTVDAAQVRAVPAAVFAAGDRVLAVWSAGRFYPGEVTAVDGESCTVKWDDGSTPSAVEVMKVIAE